MPVVRQRPLLIGTKLLVSVLWVILHLFSSALAANEEINGRAQVLSGNLILIGGKTVRLFGIQAPQLDQICRINEAKMRCGVVAWAELIRIADGAYLSCDVEKNKHKNTDVKVATCYVGEQDVGEALVRTGYAKALIAQSDRYKVDQEAAKQSARGLWAGDIFLTKNIITKKRPRRGNYGLAKRKADLLSKKTPASRVVKKTFTPSEKSREKTDNEFGEKQSKPEKQKLNKRMMNGKKTLTSKDKSVKAKTNIANKTRSSHISAKPKSGSAAKVGQKNLEIKSTGVSTIASPNSVSEINPVKEILADRVGNKESAEELSRKKTFLERIFGTEDDQTDMSQDF